MGFVNLEKSRLLYKYLEWCRYLDWCVFKGINNQAQYPLLFCQISEKYI